MSEGKLIGFVSLGLAMLLMIGSIVSCNGCNPTYSEGERTGTITKLSYKGFFVKTWEGEMNLGGMRSGDDGKITANVWQFTINDEDIVKQVQEIQRKQKPATLIYDQWWVTPVFRSDSGYIIKGVKEDFR